MVLAGLRIPMSVGLTILEVFGVSGRWSLGVGLWCCVVPRYLFIIDAGLKPKLIACANHLVSSGSVIVSVMDAGVLDCVVGRDIVAFSNSFSGCTV